MTSGIIEISFTTLVFAVCTMLVGVLFWVAKYYNNTIQDCIDGIKKSIVNDKIADEISLKKDLKIFENDLERRIEDKIEESRKSILRHFEENTKSQNLIISNLIKKLDGINPKILEKIILEEFGK